jgi:hypothetical protein
MKNSAIAARSFWDGFSLSGLFGWAKLPGGAETLVEETTDLSQSQFAELLMPYSKMNCGLAETKGAAKAEKSVLEVYDGMERSEVDEAIVLYLLRRQGKHVDLETVRKFLKDIAEPAVQAPIGPQQKKRA